MDSGYMAGPVTVAIDETKIPHFGENEKDIKGGKRDRGTNKFETYITVSVVSGNVKTALAAYPIANGDSQSSIIGDLLDDIQELGIQILRVLMDRGLNSVANILEIQKRGLKFIIPMPGNKKLYRIMEEYDKGKSPAIQSYTMKNKSNQTVTTNIVICKKDVPCKTDDISDKYIAFMTNIKVAKPKDLLKRIPEEYRMRWFIEIGYRSVKEVRAKTKSPKFPTRHFLFFFSLAFTNFWRLARVIIEAKPGGTIVLIDFADMIWCRMLKSMSQLNTQQHVFEGG